MLDGQRKVHGFEVDDVLAVARGQSRPLVPASDPLAKTKNNRVDFVLLPDDSPL